MPAMKQPAVGRPCTWRPRETGNRSVIRVLVAAGADIGARTRTGSTALHLAARANPEVVPLLLELGADLLAADDEGTAALTLIRRNKALRGLGVGGAGGGCRRVLLPRADRSCFRWAECGNSALQGGNSALQDCVACYDPLSNRGIRQVLTTGRSPHARPSDR